MESTTGPSELELAAQAFCDAIEFRFDEKSLERAEALLKAALALLLAAARAPEEMRPVVGKSELPNVSPPTSSPLWPTDEMRYVRHCCYVDKYGREDEVLAESLAFVLNESYEAISACLQVPEPLRHGTLRWHYDAELCWGDELVLALRPLHELTRW